MTTNEIHSLLITKGFTKKEALAPEVADMAVDNHGEQQQEL
jgi:hypothetical protein